jgi:hypothetical protein
MERLAGRMLVDCRLWQRDNALPAEEDFMKRSRRAPGTPSNRRCLESRQFESLAVSAALLMAVVFVSSIFGVQTVQAQTYAVLYSFKGAPDGSNPYAGLILDVAGNLYGTTARGAFPTGERHSNWRPTEEKMCSTTFWGATENSLRQV